MTRERFEELLKHHNFPSVMEFLDLVEDWYNELSPEDKYSLITASCGVIEDLGGDIKVIIKQKEVTND